MTPEAEQAWKAWWIESKPAGVDFSRDHFVDCWEAAMRFAYADAIAAVKAERLLEGLTVEDDAAYMRAISHSVDAIESRMK